MAKNHEIFQKKTINIDFCLDGQKSILNKEFDTRKLWSSGRALGSQSEGCGFNPCPMLDGSGLKAMPGLIPTPNSDSLKKNKKMQVAKWGTPKNNK